MRYGLIIVRRFPTWRWNFPLLSAVAMPMQMENESKWYMYSLCIVCFAWTLRPAHTSQTKPSAHKTDIHNSCIVVHSCHWKHSLFFVLIAENQKLFDISVVFFFNFFQRVKIKNSFFSKWIKRKNNLRIAHNKLHEAINQLFQWK